MRNDSRLSAGSEPVGTRDPDDTRRILDETAARSAAQMAAENFPVALRLLPRLPRSELATVYAYARFIDDIGDEAPGDRLALLDAVDGQVREQWSGTPSALAPVGELATLISRAAMPIEPFLDLIEANRIDQVRTDYADFDELLDYCRLSATPIGRIVLRLAGADDARNVAYSDEVCSALQVLEHCQDVGEDASAGRVYLPRDDLTRVGVTPDDLHSGITSPGLRTVIATQVDRADRMLAAGRPLVRHLSGWSRFAVAGFLAGGEATVAALRRADHDVLSQSVTASKGRTAVRLLVRATRP